MHLWRSLHHVPNRLTIRCDATNCVCTSVAALCRPQWHAVSSLLSFPLLNPFLSFFLPLLSPPPLSSLEEFEITRANEPARVSRLEGPRGKHDPRKERDRRRTERERALWKNFFSTMRIWICGAGVDFCWCGSKYRGDFVDRWRVIRREAERRVIGEQRFLEFSRLSLDGERCIGKFLFYN